MFNLKIDCVYEKWKRRLARRDKDMEKSEDGLDPPILYPSDYIMQ